MTNEELAVLIASGRKELLSDLYIQNRAIIYQYSRRFYNRYPKRCQKCGIELEDLQNEAFFALCEAVEAYNKDKAYKFITYLRYPLLNRFNELAGHRTSRIRKEPLNNCISLNKKAYSFDEDNTELIDTITDKDAEFEEDTAERCTYSGIFPAVKETLKNEFAYECIDMNYRQGISQKKIAEKYGLSNSYINSVIHKAFRELRKNKNSPFGRACRDIIDMSYNRNGVSAFKNSGMSSTEWAVFKMIKNEELSYFDE